MDKTQLTLSQALEGYFIAASARRLSPHTLADYDNTYCFAQLAGGDVWPAG